MSSHTRIFSHPVPGQTTIGRFGPDWPDEIQALRPTVGTSGPDALVGTAGNDLLIGAKGDDTIEAGAGDDRIFGGQGFDNSVFAGSIFDYEFTALNGGGLQVSGSDGVDRVFGVEALQFDDYTFFTDGRNNAPFVRGEAVTVDENAGLVLTGLLDNDMDLDGDPLTITAVTQGTAGGTVELLADGSVSYSTGTGFDWLAEGESATDTFTYDVSDGAGGLRSATVEVTVLGHNDAVVLQPSTLSGAVDELPDGAPGANSALHETSGALAFSDADLSDTHVASVSALGSGYLGTFSIDPATSTNTTSDGPVAWHFSVPDAALDALDEGETLVQSYVISVSDGHGSVLEETVTITLTGANEAPVASEVVELPATVLFGHPFSLDASAFFTDPNGDALTFDAEGLPAGLSIDPGTGLVTGMLDNDAAIGLLDITVTAVDIHGASATRSLTVNVPDPAPVAVDDQFTITGGLTISGDLSLNDPVALSPFFLDPIYEHSYALTFGVVSAGPSAGNASVVINPDGTFTYTADPRVFGSDQFAYTVTDEFGHESTAVVTIEIPQQTAVPVAGDLGVLEVDGVDLILGTDGTPTGVDALEIRIPLSDVTNLLGDSASDPLAGLQIGEIVDPSAGIVFLPTDDPDNTTRIEGDSLVLTVDASLLDPSSASSELGFYYGYPLQTEIDATVDLRPEGSGWPSIPLVTTGENVAEVGFVPGVNLIDDRPVASDDSGGVYVSGGGSVSGPLDGANGDDGQLLLLLPSGEEIPLYYGPDAYFFGNFGEVLLTHFEEILFSYEHGFDIYEVIDGGDGPDAAPSIRVVGGGDTASVIFGADGIDGGDGGDGGDGTAGGMGFIEPISPIAAIAVDGPAGADGGDGGDGGDAQYHIVGSNLNDVIVGGNAGNSGQDGADGTDGEAAPDVENTYSGGISGGEVAYGGAGGSGGTGGAGGDALYLIVAGAGDDLIYGGNAGQSLGSGQSQYVMLGGDGDDIIHAGSDLSNAELIDGQYGYVMNGGAGDDQFVFTDFTAIGHGDTAIIGFGSLGNLMSSEGIDLQGGAGFDRLVINHDSTTSQYGLMLGDHIFGFDTAVRSNFDDIEMIEIADDARVHLGLSSNWINGITTEVDGVHTLYIDNGAWTEIAFNGTASDWERTDDAVNLDGVGYDRLFNAATGTELYLDNADVLQWV